MSKRRKIFPIVLILTLLVLTIRCGGTGGGCSSGETGTINLAWDPNTEPDVAEDTRSIMERLQEPMDLESMWRM